MKFVTAFTVGHCITLVFATYFQITWNFWLVDAIIAVSVIYKGFDNNGGFEKHFNIPSPNLLGMVFAFGLLHGFGLSTRLQQLPLGDDSWHMLLRILSFNVGVELGQIAALIVMVGVLAIFRKSKSFLRFSYFANLGLMAAGIYLLFVQLHGYQHDTNAELFRFPVEEHIHIHGSKPAAKETVLKCADQRVGKLIARGKLDAGWKAITPESITTIDGEKGKEWKIVIKNPAASDKAKASLYLFFSESGNFIAANHTGK